MYLKLSALDNTAVCTDFSRNYPIAPVLSARSCWNAKSCPQCQLLPDGVWPCTRAPFAVYFYTVLPCIFTRRPIAVPGRPVAGQTTLTIGADDRQDATRLPCVRRCRNVARSDSFTSVVHDKCCCQQAFVTIVRLPAGMPGTGAPSDITLPWRGLYKVVGVSLKRVPPTVDKCNISLFSPKEHAEF